MEVTVDVETAVGVRAGVLVGEGVGIGADVLRV